MTTSPCPVDAAYEDFAAAATWRGHQAGVWCQYGFCRQASARSHPMLSLRLNGSFNLIAQTSMESLTDESFGRCMQRSCCSSRQA